MRLTLRQLQIFAAVAEAGSTAAGAGQAALSQSAASAAINELEGLLDARLFDRVGKRLILNDNGRLLLPQARQMLDAAATIERQFAAGDDGGSGLRIGASTTIGIYVLPEILAARHGGGALPRVTIANSAAVAAAVAGFEVDAGLIEGPCHEPQLVAEPWIEDELIVVSRPGDPVLGGSRSRKATLAALRDAGWLLRESGSGTREAVEQTLLPHLHRLRPAGEFGNSEAIKYAAAQGLGLACLSRSVVADLLASGRLVEVATPLPPLKRRFFLIRHRDKILSARLAAFLQVCREWTPAGRP